MKLDPKEFRKTLENKRNQKKIAENSFLRIQEELQASIEKRTIFLTEVSSVTLGAALNGELEIYLSEAHQSEYEVVLQKLGFEIGEREVKTDSLLKKVRGIPVKELKALYVRLNREVNKMVRISPPEHDTDLWDAFEDFKNVDDDLEEQVKFLLKVISYYNIDYRENNYFSLEEDAKLWLSLSRLQDVIDLFNPLNDTEQCILSYLRWADKNIEPELVPESDAPYSLLNPNKLRFLNSKSGEDFFAKISDQMNAKTDELKSYIQFDLVHGHNENQMIFSDETLMETIFSAQDLQMIFEKMGFKATWKFRKVQGDEIAAFRVKF